MCSTAVGLGLAVAGGMTCNEFEEQYLKDAQLGHSTCRNALKTAALLLSPLANAISRAVDDAKTAGFDETTFVCIDKDGRTRKYICVKASGFNSACPAVFFAPPGRRSQVTAFIQGKADSTALPNSGKIVITDAYPSCITVFSRYGIRHQLCPAHALVKFKQAIEAHNPEYLQELAIEANGAYFSFPELSKKAKYVSVTNTLQYMRQHWSEMEFAAFRRSVLKMTNILAGMAEEAAQEAAR